jgi:hypothetical protein
MEKVVGELGGEVRRGREIGQPEPTYLADSPRATASISLPLPPFLPPLRRLPLLLPLPPFRPPKIGKLLSNKSEETSQVLCQNVGGGGA